MSDLIKTLERGCVCGTLQLITHGGCFHADDVMATAIIKLATKRITKDMDIFEPEIKIIRVSNPKFIDIYTKDEIPSVVYDIGFGEFDHHQSDSEVRNNGIPYAATGLVWRALEQVFSDVIDTDWLDWMDANIIQAIDAQDNGQGYNPLSLLISAFNPNWDEIDNYDVQFSYATDIVMGLLGRQIQRHDSEMKARELLKAYTQDRIVVLKEFIPYNYLGKFEAPQCVITPSNRKGFDIHTLNNSENSKPKLPESWLTNPPAGCSFVHKGLFIANFDSFDQAFKAAKTAFE